MTVLEYPKTEQVGDKWYYWLDSWTGPKGPFESLQAANDAMTAELQSRHGW